MADFFSVDPRFMAAQSQDAPLTDDSQFVNPNIQLDKSFHWVDYIMFSSLLGLSLGVGVYFAVKGQSTTSEYLMGGRNLKVIPTALSIFMSFISAIFVLGNTAEMYEWGTQAVLATIGHSSAYLFVALVFVPLFYPLNLTSSFEYLERRFRTRKIKIIATILLIISQVLYMGIATYAPATAMEAVTGFPAWASILASGVVATAYTTIGGMKAVVWTSVIQGAVYLVGVLVILILGVVKVGGLDKVWEISTEGGRTDFWQFDPHPAKYRMTFWSVIIGTFINDLQNAGTTQSSVQRYCALPTMNKARLTVLLNIPSMILLHILTCLLGLTVYAFYRTIECDPLTAGFIENPNQLLPRYVMDVAGYPGIPGIFLAVLYSGALSTLASSLGGLSAVTWKMMEWNDTIREKASEAQKALITKLLALFFGCVGVSMAFLAGIMGGHVMQMASSFVGGVGGPLLGIFLLGALFPWSNWIGAMVGSVLGVALTLLVAIGSYTTSPYKTDLPHITDQCYNSTMELQWEASGSESFFSEDAEEHPLMPLFRMSFHWFSGLGMLTTIVVGLIVSFMTGPMDPKSHDPNLVVPIFDRIFCCLPKKFRRKMWCGIDHENDFDDAKIEPTTITVPAEEKQNTKCSYENEAYSGE